MFTAKRFSITIKPFTHISVSKFLSKLKKKKKAHGEGKGAEPKSKKILHVSTQAGYEDCRLLPAGVGAATG